nr:hypothetical protein [Thermostichus lividus]
MLETALREQLLAAQPRLLHLLDQFTRAQLLVVGDLTLDEFLTGQVERLSREAPVLILRHETTRQVPGGVPMPSITWLSWGQRYRRWESLATIAKDKPFAIFFRQRGLPPRVFSGMRLDPQ